MWHHRFQCEYSADVDVLKSLLIGAISRPQKVGILVSVLVFKAGWLTLSYETMISDWRRYSQLWKIPSPCNFKRMQVRVMYRRWSWCMDIEKNINRAVMKKSIFRVKKRWQASCTKNLAMQTKNWISQTSKTVKSFKNWRGESGVYYKDEFSPIELRVCMNVIAIKQPDRADGR